MGYTDEWNYYLMELLQTAFDQHSTALLSSSIRQFFDNTKRTIYGLNSENM
jgi:hypothetical protein